jgi:hypothetical protein
MDVCTGTVLYGIPYLVPRCRNAVEYFSEITERLVDP